MFTGPLCLAKFIYIQHCLHLSIFTPHVNENSNPGACCMKWTYTTGSPAEDFGTGDHNYCRDYLVFIHRGIWSNEIISCLNVQEPKWRSQQSLVLQRGRRQMGGLLNSNVCRWNKHKLIHLLLPGKHRQTSSWH